MTAAYDTLEGEMNGWLQRHSTRRRPVLPAPSHSAASQCVAPTKIARDMFGI